MTQRYERRRDKNLKKVIVFGASGDIGKYFVKYCNEMKKEIQIIAVGTKKIDYFDNMGIQYYQIDITKKEAFSCLPKDIYAVVDLAGIMPARMEGYDPYKYIDVNIIGTMNILEFCIKNGVDRILFSQSFGDIKEHAEENLFLKVDMPRKFSFKSDHTVYIMSKNFAVDLIENYHQQYGLKNFIFRLPTIYLWSSSDEYYVDGIIKKIGWRIILENAIRGNEIEIWGNPNRKKDMVYVKDLCQMLYRALFVEKEYGYYNVGTGVGTTLMEQVKGIVEVFSKKGKNPKILLRPDKPDAPQYIMDIESAVRELGYRPRYDYISMLKDIKKEMEEQ